MRASRAAWKLARLMALHSDGRPCPSIPFAAKGEEIHPFRRKVADARCRGRWRSPASAPTSCRTCACCAVWAACPLIAGRADGRRKVHPPRSSFAREGVEIPCPEGRRSTRKVPGRMDERARSAKKQSPLPGIAGKTLEMKCGSVVSAPQTGKQCDQQHA